MPSTHLSLVIHTVWSTKERRPFITLDLKKHLHDEIARWLKIDGTTPLAIGGVEDHVHSLFGMKATHCVADVLEKAKTESSRWMHEDARVRDFAWQVGYGAFSVSASNTEAVREYVLNQEEHHRKRTFQGEYVALLRKHEVPFNPRLRRCAPPVRVDAWAVKMKTAASRLPFLQFSIFNSPRVTPRSPRRGRR